MKTIKYLAIGSALIASSLFTSCKKEGCTDKKASNYSEEATEDDGNCNYEASAVFWYDEETSQSLTLGGSSSLKFYVEGELVGSNDASVYWTSAPNCGANASISVTKDLGKATSKTYNYEVVDNLGIQIEEGILNFSAGECETVEIE